MPSSNRCVFGCVTTGVAIHKFPHPVKYPDLFRTWVNIASELLKDMADELIYKNRYICDRHFTQNVKNRNNRLNRLAVPTLHIPKMSPVIAEGNSKDMPSTSITEMSPVIAVGNSKDMPSTSISSALHLTDSMVIDPQQPSQSSTLEILQIADYELTAINNDHSYCMKSDQSNTTKTPQTANTKKRLQGLACYTNMRRDIKQLRSEVCRLRKRSKNFKTRLASAVKLSEDKCLKKITDRMSVPAKLFTSLQFREAQKKSKGHRFTNEEKILALSLYKRSPKCYSLLSKCFVLPSAKSLKNLLGKIKISPGINQIIFEKIKHTVGDMIQNDCLCTLVFDEMSVNPQIHYNAAQDQMKGFTTVGKHNIADHVLTFMIRGIKNKYKQPVAYYFTSSLNKIELKNCIKEVVQHVQSTGLKIIATVCDQSTINVSAIESLVDDTKSIYLKKGLEWRNDFILLGNQKIIPLYDTPHLLKGIRNNLITKDLSYVDLEDGKTKLVKWEYFQKLYEADKSYGELKILQKLTEDHVNPQKINKMKVKTATQIFSRSVAVAAKHLVDSGKLDKDYLQLSPFVMVMDNLFDSLNCNTFQPVNGKMYRAGVKVNSPHHKLWQDCIRFLKNMKFIEKKIEGGKIRLVEKVVPSVKNFIKTLEGMQALWKLLNRKYDFDIMLCRHFNQDPLENFFGNIRSLGIRNVAPNTVAFEAAFKALLLNNFCSSHSIKANCEDDMSTYLQSVDFLITTKVEEKNDIQSPIVEEIVINDDVLLCTEKGERNDPESYVCGWVLRKCCINIVKGCEVCKKHLMSNEILLSNAYIKAKEYEKNKQWLCYPSEELKQCFSEIQNITVNMLKGQINPKNIKANIKILTEALVNFDVFNNCETHKQELIKYFEDVTINIILYSWCRSINRILCGKLKYDGGDETKSKAQMYYNRHQHNKNKK